MGMTVGGKLITDKEEAERPSLQPARIRQGRAGRVWLLIAGCPCTYSLIPSFNKFVLTLHGAVAPMEGRQRCARQHHTS